MICMSIEEFSKLHNIEIGSINISTLREFSKICHTTIAAGHNLFVNKTSPKDEIDQILKKFTFSYGIILYHYLNKKHDKYSYYYVLAFNTKDVVDVKKIFKIQKMKAFL